MKAKPTSARKPPAPQPELIIITGLSGSGKGTVLRALEDLGYYAVDNLPLGLVAKFAELIRNSSGSPRAALVVDSREGDALLALPRLLSSLRRKLATRLLFLDADDATLVRRFSETRRPHPLGTERSVAQSVAAERALIEPVRRVADLVINTSRFNVHDLREYIRENFSSERAERKIRVYITSFGFRHGVPAESDLVFDVRFLPNPNYIPGFRELSGRHPTVARYIRSFPQTLEFIQRISDLLIYLLPHYIQEGKTYLTISFGCTGGHHRSVFIADEIRKRLSRAGFRSTATHRDLAHPL